MTSIVLRSQIWDNLNFVIFAYVTCSSFSLGLKDSQERENKVLEDSFKEKQAELEVLIFCFLFYYMSFIFLL